jgi:hypothetical protein
MILEFMRDGHRACDHLYTEAENALADKKVDEAKKLFSEFYRATNTILIWRRKSFLLHSKNGRG